MSNKWDLRFLALAAHVASWSKDPSTKVGAVIVDAQRRVIGMGYNGFPRGVDDTVERYADRPTKYAMVVHAEVNAILNCAADPRGATIYIPFAPCADCAKLIIQAGIARVVWSAGSELEARWSESMATARTMLMEAGVQMVRYLEPSRETELVVDKLSEHWWPL